MPGRVRADGQVDEAVELAELDNLVEPTVDLLLPQPVDRGAEVDVVAAGEVLVEAGAELQQRADPPRDGEAPVRRAEHAGKKPQQGRLAGAVPPHEAHGLPGSIRKETSRTAQTSTGRRWRRRTIASLSVTWRCG